MKLKENHLRLIKHLAQFETLDYKTCLIMLDVDKTGNKKALSYVFRPLTKNKYLKKHKDGSVIIIAKGRELFPDINPLITIGGGAAGIKRANTVSHVAMYMKDAGIDSVASPDGAEYYFFVPSACWRKIRQGILSTTRFAGILFVGSHRLAVYDIGDGNMEWQIKAEGSLFYRKYNDYETRATGMLFICDNDKREDVAKRIIRQTMWNRKTLLAQGGGFERDKPVQYVRSPIRIKAQYERIYLSTPQRLSESITAIVKEDDLIAYYRGDFVKLKDPAQGDYEAWPYRFFINTTTDLLKYVYFFAAAKAHMELYEKHAEYQTELKYAVVFPRHDLEIFKMYPDVLKMEGLKAYEHRPAENAETD